MKRRAAGATIASLIVVSAFALGFALGDSSGTRASESADSLRFAATMNALRADAHSLDRQRNFDDELPPRLTEMMSELPDALPGSEAASMRVLSAPEVGDLYVVPTRTGFAILSTVGFAGTVPGGLTAKNPVVGGSAVLPDGRLAVLGIASDDVRELVLTVRGVDHRADRSGNGVWWVSQEASLDPDEIRVNARLVDGTTLRVF